MLRSINNILMFQLINDIQNSYLNSYFHICIVILNFIKHFLKILVNISNCFKDI
jgi:hypothetical protein